jgi:hypothetical protein
MKGAALARAKTEGFQGIYFGICTTLGTRIRNEVRVYVYSIMFKTSGCLISLFLHN